MANTINASTSSGLIQTADTSGIIQLQNNSTTKLAVSSSGVDIAQYNPSTSLISSATATGASGNYIDFTGIPSWAKRITVMFNGVSTNGTSLPMIQIGDSGGVETTGYAAGSSLLNPASINTSNYTTGFTIRTDALASTVMDGFITINLLNSSTNTWVAGGTIYTPTPSAYMAAVAGGKSLSATLDRVRITTVNGTDYFDAGTVNILYE
jgi:hypothetical protein